MIIYSPSVQNVLDRLYVSAVTMGKQPIEYNHCLKSIHAAESGVIRTVAQKPLSWARAGLFVAKAGRYWFGYVIQNNVVIIDEVFDCVRNTIIDESIVRKKIVLTESDLKMMVKNCVRKVLSESEQRYNVGKIGKWNRIPSNGYEFHKIPGKGTCVGIMMYVDSTSEMEIPPTYCLFRRGDNGKYFYATIVASPKDGPKATKFSIVPLKELPEEIYKDLRNLNLQA